MLPLLLFLILFINGAISDNCSVISSTCTKSYCNQLHSEIEYVKFENNAFNTFNQDLTEYSCLPDDFCNLLNDGCNYIDVATTIPYYDPDQCGTSTASAQSPIDISSTIDCCKFPDCTKQFDESLITQQCTYNKNISNVMEDLFNCYATDDILQYLQCNVIEWQNGTICPEILQIHLSNYKDCACNVLYDNFGTNAMDQYYVFSDLLTSTIQLMDDYYDLCAEYTTFECNCRIDACDANDCYTYTNCTEDELEAQNGDNNGYIYSLLQINVCYLNATRSNIWEYIKYGFNTQIDTYSGTDPISLDSYIRNYRYHIQKHGEAIGGLCTLTADIEIQIILLNTDNTFDELIDLYKYLIDINTQLDSNFAEDVLNISTNINSGFGAVEVEYLTMELYNSYDELVDVDFIMITTTKSEIPVYSPDESSEDASSFTDKLQELFGADSMEIVILYLAVIGLGICLFIFCCLFCVYKKKRDKELDNVYKQTTTTSPTSTSHTSATSTTNMLPNYNKNTSKAYVKAVASVSVISSANSDNGVIQGMDTDLGSSRPGSSNNLFLDNTVQYNNSSVDDIHALEGSPVPQQHPQHQSIHFDALPDAPQVNAANLMPNTQGGPDDNYDDDDVVEPPLPPVSGTQDMDNIGNSPPLPPDDYNVKQNNNMLGHQAGNSNFARIPSLPPDTYVNNKNSYLGHSNVNNNNLNVEMGQMFNRLNSEIVDSLPQIPDPDGFD